MARRYAVKPRLTHGETITNELSPITHMRLIPPNAPGCQQSIRAIRRADTIIIGPGDLYTSLIPNLLVPDIASAVRESDAEKVYICNLMTKHGETDRYKALDFVAAIHRYLGGPVDRVLVNDGPFSEDVRKTYAQQKSEPVAVDRAQLERLVPNVVVTHLNLEHDHLARHDQSDWYELFSLWILSNNLPTRVTSRVRSIRAPWP